MNKVILTGRLTADVVVRGQAYAFTLAVDRTYSKQYLAEHPNTQTVDFIRCAAFGKVGETISKYLKKGYPINIEGEWRTSTYQDKAGNTVYSNECYVNTFEFSIQNPKATVQPVAAVPAAPVPIAPATPTPIYNVPVPMPAAAGYPTMPNEYIAR